MPIHNDIEPIKPNIRDIASWLKPAFNRIAPNWWRLLHAESAKSKWKLLPYISSWLNSKATETSKGRGRVAFLCRARTKPIKVNIETKVGKFKESSSLLKKLDKNLEGRLFIKWENIALNIC